LNCNYPQGHKNLEKKLFFEQNLLTGSIVSDINLSIASAFNFATFGPQPLWLLMIFLPNWNVTKKIMGNWLPIIAFCLVHFFIVSNSLSQQDNTAPLEAFAGVFDPFGSPLKAMQGMMKYSNFISEEWSHVLTWDLLVGRLIWLDGIERGIFTGHSTLLTNLIGPPGLLLHLLTSFLYGKGLPPTPTFLFNIDEKNIKNNNEKSVAILLNSEEKQQTSLSYLKNNGLFNKNKNNAIKRADETVPLLFSSIFSKQGIENILLSCSEDIVWENTSEKETKLGKKAVLKMLLKQAEKIPKQTKLCIEKHTDGIKSCGFLWYIKDENINGKGLRGTTFVELNKEGKIIYVREISEPLYKPGSIIAKLLRNVAKQGLELEKENNIFVPKPVYALKNPSKANEIVKYLWNDVQGSNKSIALSFFDDNIYYEDFNFNKPFIGKNEVSQFLDEFDIDGIRFKIEKVSDGEIACSFTWRVEIAGVKDVVRGVIN
jgi:hypothetical protein